MTQRLSDRLDDVQRQYVEMDGLLLALKNARDEAEHGYRTLATKSREEAQQRERTIESLQRERAVFFNKTLFLMVGTGAFGALLAGVTNETARWLWATVLAVLSSGWATLAAWWNS